MGNTKSCQCCGLKPKSKNHILLEGEHAITKKRNEFHIKHPENSIGNVNYDKSDLNKVTASTTVTNIRNQSKGEINVSSNSASSFARSELKSQHNAICLNKEKEPLYKLSENPTIIIDDSQLQKHTIFNKDGSIIQTINNEQHIQKIEQDIELIKTNRAYSTGQYDNLIKEKNANNVKYLPDQCANNNVANVNVASKKTHTAYEKHVTSSTTVATVATAVSNEGSTTVVTGAPTGLTGITQDTRLLKQNLLSLNNSPEKPKRKRDEIGPLCPDTNKLSFSPKPDTSKIINNKSGSQVSQIFCGPTVGANNKPGEQVTVPYQSDGVQNLNINNLEYFDLDLGNESDSSLSRSLNGEEIFDQVASNNKQNNLWSEKFRVWEQTRTYIRNQLNTYSREIQTQTETLSSLNTISNKLTDEKDQINDYEQLTNNLLKEIPTKMVSLSRKDSFKKELKEILSQFDNLESQISYKRKLLSQNNDKILLINRKIDSLNQNYTSANALFTTTNFSNLDADLKILDDRLLVLANLKNTNIPEIFSNVSKVKELLEETISKSTADIEGDDNANELLQHQNILLNIEQKTKILCDNILDRQTHITDFKKIVQKFNDIYEKLNQNCEILNQQIIEVGNYDYEKLSGIDLSLFTKQLEVLTGLHFELIKITKDVSTPSASLSSNDGNGSEPDPTCRPCLPCQNLSNINNKASKQILSLTEKTKNLKLSIEASSNTYFTIKNDLNKIYQDCKNLTTKKVLETELVNSTNIEDLEKINRKVQNVIDLWSPIHNENQRIMKEVIKIYPSKSHEIAYYMLESTGPTGTGLSVPGLASTSATSLTSKEKSNESLSTPAAKSMKEQQQNNSMTFLSGKFSENLKKSLIKIKTIDNFGEELFTLLHSTRDKLDDAYDIKNALSDNALSDDQDLLETKTRLKSLLRHNLLIPDIKKKIQIIDQQIFNKAKLHAESERIKYYKQEIDLWITSVNDSIEIVDISCDLKLLELLKTQFEKIVETTEEKEKNIFEKLIKLDKEKQSQKSSINSTKSSSSVDSGSGSGSEEDGKERKSSTTRQVPSTSDLTKKWSLMKTSVEVIQNDIDSAINMTEIFNTIYKKWQNWAEICETSNNNEIKLEKFKIVKEVELENLYAQVEGQFGNDLERLGESFPKLDENHNNMWEKLVRQVNSIRKDFEIYTDVKELYEQLLHLDEDDDDYSAQAEAFLSNASAKNHPSSLRFSNLINFYIQDISQTLTKIKNLSTQKSLKTEFQNEISLLSTTLNDDSIKDVSIIQEQFSVVSQEKFSEFNIPEELAVKMGKKLGKIEEDKRNEEKIEELERFLASGFGLTSPTSFSLTDLENLTNKNQQVSSLVQNIELDLENIEAQLSSLNSITFTPVELTSVTDSLLNSTCSSSLESGSSRPNSVSPLPNLTSQIQSNSKNSKETKKVVERDLEILKTNPSAYLTYCLNKSETIKLAHNIEQSKNYLNNIYSKLITLDEAFSSESIEQAIDIFEDLNNFVKCSNIGEFVEKDYSSTNQQHFKSPSNYSISSKYDQLLTKSVSNNLAVPKSSTTTAGYQLLSDQYSDTESAISKIDSVTASLNSSSPDSQLNAAALQPEKLRNKSSDTTQTSSSTSNTTNSSTKASSSNNFGTSNFTDSTSMSILESNMMRPEIKIIKSPCDIGDFLFV